MSADQERRLERIENRLDSIEKRLTKIEDGIEILEDVIQQVYGNFAFKKEVKFPKKFKNR